jgi:hypothetical protein
MPFGPGHVQMISFAKAPQNITNDKGNSSRFMFYLTRAPLWIAGLLVCLITVAAMYAPVMLRRRVALDWFKTNNEVAGFKFATVGVIYAVLLGFAVITVWDKFSEAESTVSLEAGAAATVFRLAKGLEDESSAALRDAMVAYLQAAVNQDWPAMQLGGGSKQATQALDAAYAALLRYQPKDARGSALMTELLHQLDQVTQARRSRVVVSAGIVPSIVWIVLFGGAAITISFTFLFGSRNVYAQALMTGALSLLIFSALLVIISIDHPFAGSVRVNSEPLEAVLSDLASMPKP